MSLLMIKLIPDRTGQERVVKFDPDTGERRLVNPATPGDEHEAWPLLGAVFCDDTGEQIEAPETLLVQQKYARDASFIELVTATSKSVPAGTAADPYSKEPHVFVQCKELVFHMLDGDHRYRVLKNPGKYDSATNIEVDSAADPTTYVTWDYELKLEG